VDVDHGQLLGRRLNRFAVVMSLDKLAPVGGRAAGGRHRRRFERFAQVGEEFPLECLGCGGDIRLESDALAATMTEAVRESAERGGLKGCPLWGVRIVVLESPIPEPPPGEVAIRIAAADAIESLLAKAGTVLLEPVMKVEVTVPEEHLGDVINDLQQRRAIITATELRGGATVLTAEAPLASMFGYSAAVRSVSQGRASFTMAPLKYGPAPAETAEAYL
jgi:elongation factor G